MTRGLTAEERKQQAQEALADQETLPCEPISVRVATAVKLTGIGRSTLYELIKSGEIETIKIGRLRGDNYDGRLSGDYDGR